MVDSSRGRILVTEIARQVQNLDARVRFAPVHQYVDRAIQTAVIYCNHLASVRRAVQKIGETWAQHRKDLLFVVERHHDREQLRIGPWRKKVVTHFPALLSG